MSLTMISFSLVRLNTTFHFFIFPNLFKTFAFIQCLGLIWTAVELTSAPLLLISLFPIFMALINPSFKESSPKKPLIDKELFFVHDLINHIHGLDLFLSFKSSTKNGLKKDECDEVLKEIKTLKGLVRDHYQVGHKNLSKQKELIGISEGVDSVKRLFNTFLRQSIDVKFVLSKELDEVKYSKRFHSPSFMRMITNLIKNIEEQKTSSIIVYFSFSENNFMIRFENKLALKLMGQELGKKLQENMMKGENSVILSGLGLDSVSYLAKEMGGDFKFNIVDGKWVSSLTIPCLDFIKKAA